MKDVFGQALIDFHYSDYSEDIVTWTNISDEDILPLPYLFRDYHQMPTIEQKALQMARGNVLDIGCGSGCHSLYLQNTRRLSVKAIDTSAGAITVAKERGVLNTQNIPLLSETKSFDTLILLMNGTGIFQTLNDTTRYLNHLKSILNPMGQILIDSSDIAYMYTDIGGPTQVRTRKYYGEIDYYLSYKGIDETPFKWLYLDFETLKAQCRIVGLFCEKILEGPHYDYLARITVK